MSYNFIRRDRDQVYLMPPNLKDWLPVDHLAWFLLDAVDQMDLFNFYGKYRQDGHGRAAYEPSMMVSLLLYAYCMGERSSRRIEQLCAEHIAFRVVAGNFQPDHSTIARFRKDNEQELKELFSQVLSLCAKAGLIKAGVVALDGTKIKACAALDENRTYRHIKEEVERMLHEAHLKDEEEDQLFGKDRRGDELPEELRHPHSRLARLRECQERLEKEALEKAAEQQDKIEKRKAEEENSGRKKRGRQPKEPDPTPSMEVKANITDPDSRIMKTRKGYVQGYNAQAVVTEDQIILAAEVTPEENDVRQLHPMLRATQSNLSAIGHEQQIKTMLADAGYWSQTNLTCADPEDPELLVATTKDWKQRQAHRSAPPPRGRIPHDLSPQELMERKLLTKRGRALYKMRSQTVEPVFGQIKEVRGCDGFMRRGQDACDSEWKLLSLSHNLLKLWRHTAAVIKKTRSGISTSRRAAVPAVA